MITLPYCFLNTEIRSTIKQHWERWRLNRGSDPYIEGRNRSRFFVQVGHETSLRQTSPPETLEIRQSKINSRWVAWPIGQTNRRPSV